MYHLHIFRRGIEKLKPVMIHDYNIYMLGVDKLDQLMSYYGFLHKSIRWWRKIFFWILEVAVINAYIIYKSLALQRGERPMSHLAFRRKLILSLSEPIRSSVIPRRRFSKSVLSSKSTISTSRNIISSLSSSKISTFHHHGVLQNL